MKHRKSVLAFVAVAFVALSLLAAVDERKTASPERWQDKMQRLAELMGELLPELAAREGSSEVIERNARELAELSHGLIEQGGEAVMLPPPDADPSIALLAGRFDLDARHAHQAIRLGDLDYGKQLLRTATSHCIACHTRHDRGPDLPELPLGPRIESLSRIERAELFAATLQFDRALVEYRLILSGDAAAHWLEWERALHHALAIAVRVKQSPDLTGDLVERVRVQTAAPVFMQRNATSWAESVSRWKAEPQRQQPTEQGLYEEMKRMLEEARLLQGYPADRAADILYLRASAAAHDLLRMAPDGAHAAEAICALGSAYDVLNDPPLWPMHEIYYETCIRKAPHTWMAEECYRRYEEAIFLGYSGSGGTFIPEDVEATLAQLKQLARVAKPAAEARSAGELLYGIYCMNCHGVAGKGDGPVAPLLTVQPANLRLIRTRHGGVFPTDEIERTIDGRQPVPGHGSREMPLWGLVFQQSDLDTNQERELEARIRALTEHLASLQEPSAPAEPGGD